MKSLLYLLLFIVLLQSCTLTDKKETLSEVSLPKNNQLESLDGPNGKWNWMNKPSNFSVENGLLTITADEGTDFFNNPEDSTVTATAPFLYQNVTGDFVATAVIEPDFTSQWNAVALMVHIDEGNWIKFAFENSDATGKSIVTVVTKNISDDANGVILEDANKVWLKMIRKDNSFSMLWSLNGIDYKMARLTTLQPSNEVRVGLEAQSPVGESAMHTIHYFNVENKTIEDLRLGE